MPIELVTVTPMRTGAAPSAIEQPETITVTAESISQGFDISKFRAQVFGTAGEFRPSHFLVTINLPSEMTKNIKGASGKLSMMCEQSHLPGVAFHSESIRRYGMGPIEKMPIHATFNDIPLTFIADGNGYAIKFFHYWMNYIANFNSASAGVTMKSLVGPTSAGAPKGATPYEMRYKDDYVATVDIAVYDTSRNIFLITTLTNAFPHAMEDILLNWNEVDTLAKIPIQFSYRDWYSTAYNVSDLETASLGPDLINAFKDGTFRNTFSTSSLPQSIQDTVRIINQVSGFGLNSLSGFF